MRPVEVIEKIERVKRIRERRDPSSSRKIERDELRASANTLEETNFGFPLFVVEKDNAQNINQTEVVKDPIRELSGAFWTTKLDLAGHIYYPINTEGSGTFVEFLKDRELSKETIDTNGNLSIEEHFYFMEEDPSNVEKILRLMDGDFSKQVFSDHCCVFDTLVEEKEITESSLSPHLYAKIKSDYNYYQENYETHHGRFSEEALPNFYAFYESQNTFERTDLRRILTLDGRINQRSVNGIFYSRGLDSKKEQRIRPVGQYFNKWVLEAFEWSESDSYQSQISKFKNVIFSHKDVSLFESKNKNKQIFPMFVDLEFKTTSNSVVASFLSEVELISELQQDVVKATNDNSLATMETFEGQTLPRYKDKFAKISSGYNTEVAFGTKRLFDFDNWIQNFKETRRSQIANMIVMNQGEAAVRDEQSEFFYNLMELISKGRFDKLKQEKVRNYSDILAGTKCYNEIVFYKVDKHVGSEQQDNLNLQPVQSFYFSNIEEAKRVMFIDSQVKYGKSYTYKIYSYNLIIGSRYKIDIKEIGPVIRTPPSPGVVGSVVVKSVPTMMLMEVEIFQKHVIIMDNPPVAPEVEIIPFRGVQDKIRIFLTSGVGSYDFHPISIEQEEGEEIEKLRIAQDIEEDEKVRFESDDAARSFIVYRMESKPKNYQDFQSSLIREISTGRYPSVALDDKIKPNKKYYYCFKSIDIHDHYSYPSFVYEVELVSDSGAVYPLIRTVEFNDPEPKHPTKPVKRLIHIKPAVLQTEIDEERSGLGGLRKSTIIGNSQNIYLGQQGQAKIWGQNFKVRLTSKSSGKKVDFNFTFDHEKLPTRQ